MRQTTQFQLWRAVTAISIHLPEGPCHCDLCQTAVDDEANAPLHTFMITIRVRLE